MILQSSSGGWGWRGSFLGVLAACAAGTVVAYATAGHDTGRSAAVAAAGHARDRGGLATASLARMRAAVIARLHAQRLDYRWVACVRTPSRFHGVGVVRCNVDFGIDPHVEAYCSVLRGGRLLTDVDDPAVPCGHDDAGYSATIIRYG